ncbi:hypothetical protein KC19_10G142700 [Ceratodon purpureus]|uniref:Sec-independent protein translocase protein TATA, chloroplastic n=1 Tax=Ceratodon purpureus TaxID=3225 RepID=A0A8T0GP34_CERPU|nr:hypothetical protein KC19_10G142700 [Ceratodon purpureus]
MAMAVAGACAGVVSLGATGVRTSGATRAAVPSAFVSSEVHSSTSSGVFSEGRSQLRMVARPVERRQTGGLAVRGLFGLGVPELAVIAGVAALVFGPKQLPAIGKSLGKTVKSFQTAAKEFESEISKAKEPETENENTAIEESPKEEVITSTPIATPKTPENDASKSS